MDLNEANKAEIRALLQLAQEDLEMAAKQMYRKTTSDEVRAKLYKIIDKFISDTEEVLF